MKIIHWLIAKYRDCQTFRRTMREWLGDGGKPVPSEISQARANLCLSCPYNVHNSLLQPVGDAILRHFKAKWKIRLTAWGEQELHVCQICHCTLSLKIHVPHTHIRAWQREEVRRELMEKFPQCWQLDPLR